VRGEGAESFRREAGGHRWQRIPPTERRGRVHTSTVTVAVLDVTEAEASPIPARDVEFSTARGSGPGGQHRNKTETCVTAVHLPTGISVRIDGRSQWQNKKLALAVLAGRLSEIDRGRSSRAANDDRRRQIGSGERGDKVRTYRVRDDLVTDHRTGERWRLSAWQRGEV